MGRGSRQKQTQRQSSAAAAAEAAAPPPQPAAPAAQPVPDEVVWRLLLGELWQAPDAQLVCRLLCCSRAMGRLVHAACAGRVVVRITRQPRDDDLFLRDRRAWLQQVAAYGQAYSAWLAKHARLLAELELELWGVQEEHVAAGLRAAAGLGATDMPQRVTRSRAAAFGTAAAAAAAAAQEEQEEAGPAAQPQPLPLQGLRCNMLQGIAPAMRLLHSLAACPQVTQLHLSGTAGDFADRQQRRNVAAAFAPLHSLRELSFQMACSTGPTLSRLQLGSQLTKLQLVSVELSAACVSSLPPSLADLEYHYGVYYSFSFPHAFPTIGHLTALTRLSCNAVDAGTRVPPSVEVLQLHRSDNPAPLHHLTRLRSLECRKLECTLEQLQDAVAAIGPSLTSLDLRALQPLMNRLVSQRVTGPVLPLRGLSLIFAESVRHLGQWTGLTRLHLACWKWPAGLPGQLKQLTALEELELEECRAGLTPSELQELVECVVGMTSLRGLRLVTPVLNDEQRAQLRGMTQLTQLEF